MDWKEFIEGESGRHGLSKEQMETLLETLCSSTNAHTNQQKIADKFNISVPTVKQRMGEVYKGFERTFPELGKQKGAGKLRLLYKNLRENYSQISQPVVTPQPSNSSPYPEEFVSLIKNNNKTFCGGRFVFEAFEQFISTNEKGYFVLVGYA